MSASIVTFANLGSKRNLRTTDIVPAVEVLAAAGELRQVVCQLNGGFHFKNTHSAVPVWLRYPMRAIEKISGKTFSRRTTEKLFDYFAARRLVPADMVFLHGSYVMPRTVRRARALGAKVVDISVNANFVANALLEREEFEHLGISGYRGLYSQLVGEAPTPKLIDYMVLMSEFTKRTYVAAGYPAERIYIAHLDIDTKRFSPPAQTRPKDAPFKLLYLAHTQPLKGLHYLLDAWEQVPFADAELLIVGGFSDMPDELKEKYITRMRSDKRITWLAGTHEPERFLRDASVFVSASLTEGFGRISIEAMACGVPVITTEHAQGIVEDGKTGFVVPIRDAKAIADKIKYLYEHRDEAAQMGAAARTAVEAKKPFGEAVYEIYRDIMQREGKAVH